MSYCTDPACARRPGDCECGCLQTDHAIVERAALVRTGVIWHDGVELRQDGPCLTDGCGCERYQSTRHFHTDQGTTYIDGAA